MERGPAGLGYIDPASEKEGRKPLIIGLPLCAGTPTRPGKTQEIFRSASKSVSGSKGLTIKPSMPSSFALSATH